VQSVFEPLKFFDKIHTTNVEIEFESGSQNCKFVCNKRKSFWVPSKNSWCTISPSFDPTYNLTTK